MIHVYCLTTYLYFVCLGKPGSRFKRLDCLELRFVVGQLNDVLCALGQSGYVCEKHSMCSNLDTK